MSTTAALLKLPCILAVTLALHIVFTPPGDASKGKVIPVHGLRGKVLTFGIGMLNAIKAVFWATGAVEMAVIIAEVLRTASLSSRPARAIADMVLSTLMMYTDRAQNLVLTPISMVGLGLVVAGAMVRWKCYQTMGSQFTSELVIQKNHKLITTGPYRFVRHPSYSGGVVVEAGALCWFCGRGSWVRESGVLDTKTGSVFFYAFALFVGTASAIGVGRMGTEDKELKRVFGEKWDKWARRVPYRLVPGVY